MRGKVLQNRMLIGHLVQPPANAGILSTSFLLSFFLASAWQKLLPKVAPFVVNRLFKNVLPNKSMVIWPLFSGPLFTPFEPQNLSLMY